MQSNPRILVNLLVKLTRIGLGGAIGAGEYTRERLVRLGGLAEGQGPGAQTPGCTLGVVAQVPQRGRRSGKAPVVLGLARGSDVPGFARGITGNVTEFHRLFGLSWEDVLTLLFHMVLLQHAF